jgi:hypothetical protein
MKEKDKKKILDTSRIECRKGKYGALREALALQGSAYNIIQSTSPSFLLVCI